MRHLVWDIETVPDTTLAVNWTPKTPDEFPPLYAHRVVCIGMLLLDDDLKFVKAGCAADGSASRDEKRMVARFIEVMSNKTVVTVFHNEAERKERAREAAKVAGSQNLVDFNGKGFDLPVIQHRAMYHGLSMPFYFERQCDNYGKISSWSKEYRDRYAGRHIDLCDEWSNHGGQRRPSLHTLAQLCGLPGKQGVQGSDAARLYAEECFQTLDRYCMEDVYQTAMVFLRWLHLKGELSRDACTERLQLILDHVVGNDCHPAFYNAIDRERLLLK